MGVMGDEASTPWKSGFCAFGDERPAACDIWAAMHPSCDEMELPPARASRLLAAVATLCACCWRSIL
eukprot:6048087-Pleurochrysis_carterae.AAC.1